MRHGRWLLVVVALVALGSSLQAGPAQWSQAGLDFAQAILSKAAVDPTPASLALMVLILGLVPFSVVVPMTACCIFAGAVLPVRLGPPVLLAGMLLNTAIAWVLARSTFGHRLEAWIEERGGALGQLRLAAKRAPFKWAFFSRFIPAPFALTPMVLASAGVSLSQVFWATALVMTPWAVAYTWVGHESRQGSLGSLALAGMGVAAISALTLWAYKRYVVPAEARDSRNPTPAKGVFRSQARRKAPPRKGKA